VFAISYFILGFIMVKIDVIFLMSLYLLGLGLVLIFIAFIWGSQVEKVEALAVATITPTAGEVAMQNEICGEVIDA